MVISQNSTDSRKQILSLTDTGTVLVGRLIQENATPLSEVLVTGEGTLRAAADALKGLRASFPAVN
jgi:DNA-binding MarR family transcriptional regulator